MWINSQKEKNYEKIKKCDITTQLFKGGKERMGRKQEINVETAARIMKKNAEYVRLGLQNKQLDFGSAVQKEDGKWSYHIVPNKFYDYMGIKRGDYKWK